MNILPGPAYILITFTDCFWRLTSFRDAARRRHAISKRFHEMWPVEWLKTPRFSLLFSFQFRFGWIETTKSVLNLIESRVFEAKNQKHQVFNTKSRWWFQSFFYVHPDPCGSMIQFDSFILFNWVETQPPTPFKEKYKTPKVCPLAPHPWRPPPRSGASTNGLVQDIAGRQRTLIQRMAKDTFFGLKFAWGPKNKTMWNRTTVVFFCLSVGS